MKKKFMKLMEKEEFILFLFVCVCVVAAGTWFVSVRNLDVSETKPEEELVILENSQKEDPSIHELDPSEYIDERETFKEEELEEDVATLNQDNNEEEADETEELELEEEDEEEELEFIDEEEADDVESVSSMEEKPKFSLPIEGPIITEFTKDALVYSQTLESWVGHKAIDIGAKEGTPVLAPMDGVVEKVYEDELWGIVILLDHGNGLKTKYANLSTRDMVKVGINVKKGDHISKVGKSAKIEMLMEPHLHFEVIKNGEIVDPRSINK